MLLYLLIGLGLGLALAPVANPVIKDVATTLWNKHVVHK